ncbi:hypothetical protein Tco_0684752 [Tanacetum coccineum]
MPPKGMSAAAIQKLVADKVAEALVVDRASRANADGSGGNVGESGGQGRAPPARKCSFAGYMKCSPTTFHGNEEAIELCHWFKKTKITFKISGYAERNKVMFADATLQGRALTWWNSELVQLCPDVVPNEKKKVEAYIKGLPENIKGETNSSKPVVLNDAV